MTEETRKLVCIETVKAFGKQEWFRDVIVHDAHPVTGEPTLELKVNYLPLFERKPIKDFALRFNLTERFIVVDRQGNPQE